MYCMFSIFLACLTMVSSQLICIMFFRGMHTGLNSIWVALKRCAGMNQWAESVLFVINRMIEHEYISTDWANKTVTFPLPRATRSPDLWPQPCLNTLPFGLRRESQSEVKKKRIVNEKGAGRWKEEIKETLLSLRSFWSHFSFAHGYVQKILIYVIFC